MTQRLSRMTFDNFDLRYYPEYLKANSSVSYRSLAEKVLNCSKSFCQKVISRQPVGSLLFEGEVGTGKTHLAAAIANELIAHEISPLFLVVPEFLDQLKGSYHRESKGLDETEIIKRAYEAPVLILDDLGAHNFTAWVQNKLFTIINHRYNRNLPCVITTNLNMDQLDDNIGLRTSSRILETSSLLFLKVDRDVRHGQNLAEK